MRLSTSEEGNSRPLSDKTVYNIYVSISAFFTWTCRKFEIADPYAWYIRNRILILEKQWLAEEAGHN